ncbi:hypothetical protein [Anabaena azotica]
MANITQIRAEAAYTVRLKNRTYLSSFPFFLVKNLYVGVASDKK